MDELLGYGDGSSHALSGSPAQGRAAIDHHALMPRSRELNDWIPSEGGPLAGSGYPAPAHPSFYALRDEHRGDEQRPAQDPLRIRSMAAQESLLVREGELMSKLHDLLHSPLGQGIARIIEELHQIHPKARDLA